MSPSLASNNVMDITLMYSEEFSDLCLVLSVGIASAYFNNISFSELCVGVFRANRHSLRLFRSYVGNLFFGKHRNVFPVQPLDDQPDRIAVYSKSLRYVSVVAAVKCHLSNFKNVCIAQFHIPTALLNRTVRMIVGVGADKKVVRPTTRRVVAFMKDVKPSWNVAEMKHPRDSMGVFVSCSQADVAVSCASSAPCPNPARTKFWSVLWHRSIFVDPRPKPVDNSLFHKQETTPLAKSIAGEVKAAVCKRSGNDVSLHDGRNKAASSVLESSTASR